MYSLESILNGLINLLLTYSGAWIVLTLLEWLFPARKQALINHHLRVEISFILLNSLFVYPIAYIITTVMAVYFISGTFDPLWPNLFQGWPIWAQILLGLFMADLVQYLRHRFMHRFFWSAHVSHHSAVELRSTVHFRMHPFDYVISVSCNIYAFYYLLGFDPEVVVYLFTIGAIINMWEHSNIEIDFPSPFKYLLVSPNYHKWHHARAREGIDKNFADIFPILDIVGGTYFDPEKRVPPLYGIMGLEEKDTIHQTFWRPLVFPLQEAAGYICNNINQKRSVETKVASDKR